MIGASSVHKRSSSAYVAVLLIFFTSYAHCVTSLTVKFNESKYIVNENDRLVQPVLVLNESSSTDIIIQVIKADNIAEYGGEDISDDLELFNITIPAGKTTASFNIIITANNTLKDNRTFYLMIIEDSLHKNIILGENNIAKIVVVNNDNLDEVSTVSINFNQSVYIVNENDKLVQVTIVLNNSVTTDITVQVRTNDYTATGGDYNSGPYNVTFLAGATNVLLNITINKDDILEGNETFMLIIVNSSLSQGFVFITGDNDTATITIIDTTKLFARPRSKAWYVNTTATLSCVATASGSIKYQWRRVNGEITSERVKGVNTSTLTISPVTEQDEGQYYCVATYSTVNRALCNITSNKGTITVYGPPVVKQLSISFSNQEEKPPPISTVYYIASGIINFRLHCVATIDPQSPTKKLKFGWYKDSAPIRQNVDQLLIVPFLGDKSDLLIRKVDADLHNGTYTCSAYEVADNRIATQRAALFVEIPTMITTHPHSVNVSIGESVILSCKATGSDPIRYQWSRVNGEISSNSKGVNTSNLTISSVTEQDEDEYYCIASNGGSNGLLYEETSNKAMVMVYAVSSTPASFTDSATSSTPMNTSTSVSTTSELFTSGITAALSSSTISRSNTVMDNSSSAVLMPSSSTVSMTSTSNVSMDLSYTVSMTSSSSTVSMTSSSTVSMDSSSTISMTSSSSTVSMDSSSTISMTLSSSTNSKTSVPTTPGSSKSATLTPSAKSNFTTPSFFIPSITINSTTSMTSRSTSFPIVSTPSITSAVSGREDGSGGINSGTIGAVVGVVSVLIIIIVIVIIVIFVLMRYKKRYKQLDSLLASPISTKLEMSLQETVQEKKLSVAGSKSLPLIMIREEQIKTSVGQPTTLHIIVRGDPMPEINWSKDKEPITYPMQEDGSLYIYNTSSDDQGCYTVTATNSEGESSQAIQLVVLNPRFVPSNAGKKPIKVEDFAEHLAMLQANMNEQFRSDYESLVSGIEYTFHAARLGPNIPKNRYKNILPYDHSRVVLKLKENCPGSDYINGSFIDGYKEKNAYIACQGPMESTVSDFWRMVWEKCVNTIVMITNLNEEGKPKCYQYWPENKNDSITCDNICVTLLEETVLADYTVRKLILKMTEDSDEAKGVSLEVKHFQYTVWPDHGVPKYATSMLLFHKCVFEHHKRRLGTPLLVHCSAGVGRTGTFVSIDIELQRIKQQGVVDVYNTVYKLRYQRVSSVQTIAQYVFVFDALMESIMCGDNSINVPANVAKERLEKLAKVNPATKLSGYEVQFKKLEEASPKISDFTYEGACMNQNWQKNRSMKRLPPDGSRVYITRDKLHSDYICASYVDGYHHRRAFMITEGPMESTLVDFWTMIWEKNSHAIVMLSLLEEDGEEVCAKYWPNQGDVMESGRYVIQNTNEKTWGKYFVRRILKIYNSTEVKDAEPRIIHQFHYLCWPDHSCPPEASSIMDLVEMVEKQQRQTNNGPITVHCSDGVGRTGAFCALMLCRQRLLTEHMADVFCAIKTLRAQRPGMVENLDQYVFIHKTLVETMDRLDRYSNLHA